MKNFKCKLNLIAKRFAKKTLANLASCLFLSAFAMNPPIQCKAYNTMDTASNLLQIFGSLIISRKPLTATLDLIATGKEAPPNEHVQKLALLWHQFREFTNQEQIDANFAALRDRYHAMVDAADDRNALLNTMQTINTELTNLASNRGIIFSPQLTLPPELQAEFDEHNQKYSACIAAGDFANAAALGEYVIDFDACIPQYEVLTGLPHDQQSALEECLKPMVVYGSFCSISEQSAACTSIFDAFSGNYSQLKTNLQTIVDSYFKNLGCEIKSIGPDRLIDVFIDVVGLAIQRAVSVYQFFGKSSDTLFQEAGTDLKQCYIDMINETSRLCPESKSKVIAEIQQISINGKSHLEDTSLDEIDGLENFQFADNFWGSIAVLKHSQQQALAGKSADDLMILEKKVETRTNSLLASRSSCTGASITMETSINPHIWENLSKIPAIFERYGVTPEELLKILMSVSLSHEMGHAVDHIFGTNGAKDASTFICQDEKQSIINLRNELASCSEEKGKILNLNWHPTTQNTQISKMEIFADYLAFEAFHRLLARKLPAAQITKIAELFCLNDVGCFSDYFNGRQPIFNDGHPPVELRFDSLLGLHSWFYELGLDIHESDLVWVSPEKRIVF
ncbi:MAG: hypothetical protein LBJ95_01390 [Oscillospiraceae bacterium]|jgi:hypothetical protein|nr:hypothetical protein [Oscillospiraceae bacterium]